MSVRIDDWRRKDRTAPKLHEKLQTRGLKHGVSGSCDIAAFIPQNCLRSGRRVFGGQAAIMAMVALQRQFGPSPSLGVPE